jgi:toxin HigB-1
MRVSFLRVLDIVTLWVTILAMIISFKHKGLERFYKSGSTSGIQAAHSRKLNLILSNLDQAESPADMDLPGLKLYELKGNMKGIWSVVVNGNWRITYKFVGSNVELVNYEDYH